MSMRLPILLLLATTLIVAACFPDAFDQGQSNCQVQSPNNTWTNNNVRVHVRSPFCPVKLDNLGQSTAYSTYVYAPTNLQRGNVVTRIYDAANFPQGYTEGLWSFYSSTEERAAETGSYFAGVKGTMFNPVNQDYADTQFPTRLGLNAAGLVLLPYTCCSAPSSISQIPAPRAGQQTNVRLITNGVSTSAKISWYLDGVRVLPAGTLANPKRDTLWTGVVNSAGIHNWKVEIVDGFPQTKKTLTWTQRFQ